MVVLVNCKILIVSCVTLRVIFQNLVTFCFSIAYYVDCENIIIISYCLQCAMHITILGFVHMLVHLFI